MLTFFEFYETLLGFVLFKLYGEFGVRYPLPTVASGGGESNVSSATLHPTLGGKATSVLAANLSALQLALNEAAKGNSAADAVKDAMQSNDGSNEDGNDAPDEVNRKAVRAQKKKQRELMQSIDEALKGVEEDGDDNEDDDDDDDDDFVDEDEDQVPIAAPLREALEAIDDSAISMNDNGNIITNPEAQKRHQLFHNMTFFLSREVPRGYLELIILSYGGKVGWEGQDSPILMDDSSITHHVVDRPKLLPSYGTLPKSREYIQPQWVLDCANFNFILPVQKYGVGHELPPHLSPWVDDNEEGYVPKYKEEIEKIRNGEMLDENEEDNVDSGAVKAIIKDNDEASEGDDSASEKDAESIADESEEDVESEEEDDAVAERKAIKKKQTEVSVHYFDDHASLFDDHIFNQTFSLLLIHFHAQDEEAAELAKALMSKKAARLYGRMQHGIAQKQAKVDNLHKKRREIESSKEKSKAGKTQLKLKVERLKKERREKEDKYEETGGSMKKKRRNN
jgi:pescadillo protein